MRFLVPWYLYTCIHLATVINQVLCENCSALKSETVNIICEYKGYITSCQSPIFPGTKATLACKNLYKIPITDEPIYKKITCLKKGVWDHALFNCILECGISVAHGRALIINGFAAKTGAFPWHVGIYRISSNGYHDQICAGTLVSPELVISAAHCFHDETLRIPMNAKSFAVAVGKYYRSYDVPEPDAQKSKIDRINLPERYFGGSRNYEQDIALIRLETPFTMTPLIRPICMDWENRYERRQLQNGRTGKIMGWGVTAAGIPSSELQEMNLPFVHYEECISAVPEDFIGFITADKFCAGYLNGSSLCNGDSGGGLCFQFDGVWYLRGIASVGPVSDGMCDRKYYTAFTNVGDFIDWIRGAYLSRRNLLEEEDHSSIDRTMSAALIVTSGCVLSREPDNGRFEFGSCKGPCNVALGSRVPVGSFLIYKCNEGYTVDGISNVTVCEDIAWNPPPTCIRNSCPALISKSVDFVCEYQGIIASCESAIAPGTKVTMACKNLYEISLADDPGYREITCLEDGTWNRSVFECVSAKPSRRYCPALKSKSVDFECRYRGKTVSCEAAIVPWTKATLACKNYYKLPFATDLGYRKITCLEDGVWDRAVFNCTLECGMAPDESTPLIVNGSPVRYEGPPWRVFIYQKHSNGLYLIVYGGILVSPILVITTAPTFDDETVGTAVNASKYAVTVGNFRHSYNVQEPYVQKSQVIKIDLPDGFSPKYLAHNIALLHLETPITVTNLVTPICLDWDNRFEIEWLQSQKRDEVVASGNTSSVISLPYTQYDECLLRVTEADKPYLGPDKFCTGCEKVQSKCEGFTHGYAFGCEFNGVWYLLGIQSSALSSRDSSCAGINVFTKIEPYLEWIHGVFTSAG